MYGMEQPGPIQCEYLLTSQGIVTSLEGFVSIELVSFSVKNNAFPYWPGTGLNLMALRFFPVSISKAWLIQFATTYSKLLCFSGATKCADG